jgi:pyruvate/2-oxoglutarate dehydrogenase complex dihydrolipoamide dehydrogenase (E3) component
LRYRAAIIATGSRPAVPPIPGLEGADFLTNETVWDLRALPTGLTVLGGGSVGCELGQAFARLGTRVELVEAAPVLLPGEDSEAGSFIANTLAGEGVTVQLEAPVTQVEPAPEGGGALVAGGRRLDYDSSSGKPDQALRRREPRPGRGAPTAAAGRAWWSAPTPAARKLERGKSRHGRQP